MRDIDLSQKRALIRVDLNVPLKEGQVQNDARLRAIIPTLRLALAHHARIILISHLGRPQEGHYSAEFSLKPVADYLAKLLDHPIRFISEWLDGIEVGVQEIVLCENVRFNTGEKANDDTLAKRMANLCDVFVMDAFATAHRSEASTVGVAKYAPMSVAGPLLLAEIEALTSVMHAPKRPLVAIVGGAKVSDKLQVLKSLILRVDSLLLGGGIANTFIAALGYSVGASLFEPDLVSVARELLQLAKERQVNLVVPVDAIVAEELSDNSLTNLVSFAENSIKIKATQKIFDVGPETVALYSTIIRNAGTILWNGPLGVFEWTAFSKGTEMLAQTIAESPAFSVGGGGETIAAIDKYGVREKISYISTGGGAFLEYLEGKSLPSISILEHRAKDK